MNKLVRIAIVTIVGLQVLFWIPVFLWLKLNPQAPQDSEPTAGAKVAESIIVVEMNDKLRFVPTEITIKAGDTVEWRNIGSIPHTVTADPRRVPGSRSIVLPAGAEAFDSGWVMGGRRFRYTFSESGVYRFICLPHERAQMLGAVIVG